jgi:hypothetical protein
MSSIVTEVCRLPSGASSVLCSPDGRRVAYAVKNGNKHRVEVDGIAIGEPDYDFVSGIRFSDDSSRIAFVAFRALRATAVCDGTEHEWWDDISRMTPVITPDNGHVVFGGRENGKWFLIRDTERLGGPYDGFAVGGVAISRDSKRIGWAIKNGDGWEAVVDGEAHPRFVSIQERSWRFSPDASTFAYIAAISGSFVGNSFVGTDTIVLNGKTSRLWPHDEIRKTDGVYREIFFSPDSMRYAYYVTNAGTGFFVVDDRPESVHGALVSGWQNRPDWSTSQQGRRADSEGGAITFSPDSKHFAYAVATTSCQVVLDSQSVGTHDRVLNMPIVFGPDSAHFVYATANRAGHVQTVWRDGEQVLSKTDSVLPIAMEFSPDGSRVAYGVIHNGRPHLSISGELVPLSGTPLPGSRVVWINADQVAILTGGERAAILLETISA